MISQDAKLSRHIKRKCVEVVTKHLKKDFSLWRDRLFSKMSGNGEIDQEEGSELVMKQLDQFILFGETRNGEHTIDAILSEHHWNFEERNILLEWKEKAFESMFEIVEIGRESLRLFDIVAEVEYKVFANADESPSVLFSKVSPDSFMRTNMAPVNGAWFLSGGQNFYGRNLEKLIFKTVICNNFSSAAYRNNPKKLEAAFKLQKEEFDRFVHFFGADEVVCQGCEVDGKLQEFYIVRAKELGNTYEKEVLANLIDSSVSSEKDIGIVVDEKEGMHFFTDYGSFVQIFRTPDNRPEFWREILREYLAGDSFPAFIFRKMKDKYPNGFCIVINDFLKNETFKRPLDPIEDFDFLMGFYKPRWREEIYPSVHPTNERFREYYEQNGLED